MFFKNGRLLLHWAASGGHDSVVSYLLELGSPIDPVDDGGNTPLLLASTTGKSIVVRILISRGANVNHKNNQGHSALQYACSKGWKEVYFHIYNKVTRRPQKFCLSQTKISVSSHLNIKNSLFLYYVFDTIISFVDYSIVNH